MICELFEWLHIENIPRALISDFYGLKVLGIDYRENMYKSCKLELNP